jgi:glutamate decarboxylase/sulfinoalanine decarboxylase
MPRSVIDGIIERVKAYLLDPQREEERVVALASPEELTGIVDESVGLSLASSESAHGVDGLLAAVEQLIEYSVHTSHPRFVNQNFAGPDPVAVVVD